MTIAFRHRKPAVRTIPELPRVFIDTTYSAPTGVRRGPGGGVCTTAAEFTAALAALTPGDYIELQAGNTFQGPFTLPNLGPDGPACHIRSSAYASLPAPGTRVAPSDATNMAKILAGSGGAQSAALVLLSASGSNTGPAYYRLIGLECTYSPSLNNDGQNGVIEIGGLQTTVVAAPHSITVDRCYCHGRSGDSIQNMKGILCNGVRIAVIDSYVDDFKDGGAGFESQALSVLNCPGPLKIVNNYLESATENILTGGADIGIPNLVTEDVEIRLNTFAKRAAWNPTALTFPGGVSTTSISEPTDTTIDVDSTTGFGASGTAYLEGIAFTYTGKSGTQFTGVNRNIGGNNPATYPVGAVVVPGPVQMVKDLLEFKNTRRALIEGNIFLDHWAGAQSGNFIQITPRATGSYQHWEVVEDLTIRHNIAYNVTAGIGLSLVDVSIYDTVQGARFMVENNLVLNLGTSALGGGSVGVAFPFGSNGPDVMIRHNTMLCRLSPLPTLAQAANFAGADDNGGHGGYGRMIRFVERDNIIVVGGSLVIASGTGQFAEAALDVVAPTGWTFAKNVLVGPWPTDQGITVAQMPEGNFYPQSVADVGFENFAGSLDDYHGARLSATSQYKGQGTNGTDPGVDLDALDAALALGPNAYV